MKPTHIAICILFSIFVHADTLDFIPQDIKLTKIGNLDTNQSSEITDLDIGVILTFDAGHKLPVQLKFVYDEVTKTYIFGPPAQKYIIKGGSVMSLSFMGRGIYIEKGEKISNNITIEKFIATEISKLEATGARGLLKQQSKRETIDTIRILPMSYLTGGSSVFNRVVISDVTHENGDLIVHVVNERNQTALLKIDNNNKLVSASVTNEPAFLFKWENKGNNQGIVGLITNLEIPSIDGSRRIGEITFEHPNENPGLLGRSTQKIAINGDVTQLWVGPSNSRLVSINNQIYGITESTEMGSIQIIKSNPNREENIQSTLETAYQKYKTSKNIPDEYEWITIDVIKEMATIEDKDYFGEKEITIGDVTPAVNGINIVVYRTGRTHDMYFDIQTGKTTIKERTY